LELRSGNDDSPNSLKQELDAALNGQISSQDQLVWLEANGFDQATVAQQMKSFAAFRQSLGDALALVAQ
jgi:hypothetical protein